MKLIDSIIKSMELMEEDADDEFLEPQKQFNWLMVLKIVILCAALVVCLVCLRRAPLQVFPGETQGTYSLCLEAECLPAIWMMLFVTLVHSAFPLFFHWEKIYQKLLWVISLPAFMTLFMPMTLVKQTTTAMVIFCREFGKEPSVFHFISELYDYNAWYMEATDILLLVELFLFVLYYFAGKKKTE